MARTRKRPAKGNAEEPKPPTKKERFIALYAQTGKGWIAAKLAGYECKDRKAFESLARVMYHRHKVEIEAEVSSLIERGAGLALRNIRKIAADPRVPAKVRLDANRDLLDRGKHIRAEARASGRVTETETELAAQLEQTMGTEQAHQWLRDNGLAHLAPPIEQPAKPPATESRQGQEQEPGAQAVEEQTTGPGSTLLA